MWNKEKPIKMLNAVDQTYEIETIKAIQKHIDIDKFLNSYKLNFDLCGYYAPFCDYCSKMGSYPCAYAFFKFKHCTKSNDTIAEVLEKAHPTMIETVEKITDEAATSEDTMDEKKEEPKQISLDDENFEQLDIDSLAATEPQNVILTDEPYIDESEIIEQTKTPKKVFRLAVARRKNI